MAEGPMCFVIMPSGSKPDPGGRGNIDFDRIYEQAIAPAVRAAGLNPVRDDTDTTGGVIHRASYEKLLLCEYAVADVTAANPAVFYELGVRHAARPRTTVVICAAPHSPPFNLARLRALPYELGEENRFGAEEAAELRRELQERLRNLSREASQGEAEDSPLLQLLDDSPSRDVKSLKTDLFRDRVLYSERLKEELKQLRDQGDPEQVKAFEERLGKLDEIEVGVLVDLYLSYRALQDWKGMVRLYQQLPAPLQRTILIREQLGFAYNRLGERDRALEVLREVEQEQGPSSETLGLIGRVYKDKWQEATRSGSSAQAQASLDAAIEAYVRGFETDWRDHYPGINAVTLLDIKGGEAALEQKRELLPVVRFSVQQRLKGKTGGYWDHATLLELAVLEGNRERAESHLADALAAVRETWEPQSTANNLTLILDARRAQGRHLEWLPEIIRRLSS